MPLFSSPRALAAILALSLGLGPAALPAQVTGFRQAVAEVVAGDESLAAFYRAREFQGAWAGDDALSIARRNALLGALADAPSHGLPSRMFDPVALMARLEAARDPLAQGEMDVELSRVFLDYAHAVQTGVLTPGQVVPLIKREVPVVDGIVLLEEFFASDRPVAYLQGLAPRAPEYVRLMRARAELDTIRRSGGWGPPVASQRLEAGDTGPDVVLLRNKLISMGFLEPTVSARFDAEMVAAVRAFQESVGLTPDGIVGGETRAQLNTSVEDRLRAVLVAMERERWMNIERGERHVWVNLTDFVARVVDEDEVSFETRAVIGHVDADRQTPEFSDVMEHMVINPTWFVPRSIIVNEYLPQLRRNPGAVGHLQLVDSRGRVVSRNQNFAAYSDSGFPYSMRQPPGPGNALGRVKFMFPNRYNIYLHDTPARNLFANEVRAYSHGCIRLNDPLEFGYHLLARQSDDPEGLFNSHLRTGRETRVDLEQPIPVHLVYRTAYTAVDGTMQYRRDIYGRDARIWAALAAAGVEIGDHAAASASD